MTPMEVSERQGKPRLKQTQVGSTESTLDPSSESWLRRVRYFHKSIFVKVKTGLIWMAGVRLGSQEQG